MGVLVKGKYSFLFQGVGVEYKSLLHLLNEKQLQMLKSYCSIVHKELELDLWNYLHNSIETKYGKMFNDWVAIYTIDCIVYHTYIDFGFEPAAFLGYSMGLVTALACGESITFEAGLHLLYSSYEYAQYVPRKKEAMAVITGMTSSDVENIIKNNSLENSVEIASENNDYCIVVSGIKDYVNEVMKIAADEGAMKVKDINAPYAFHSHLALMGVEKYQEFISTLPIADSAIPIISSYNQNIIQESCEIKQELKKNTSGRMYWKSSIEKAIAQGCQGFIEVSMSDTITKFSKIINMDYQFITYKKFTAIK